MSGSKVAWEQKCTRVWNKKLEGGSDGTRWCSDDQEEFLRGVQAEFNSSNMLITDCINNIKRWFSTQCAENGSTKLPEESDDEDESFVAETDPEVELEDTEKQTRAVVTKKATVEKWQPRMYEKVRAPFPIDGNPCSTMVGGKKRAGALGDDMQKVQDFEAMVVHVDEENETVGLNYFGIGGYHPSVRISVITPMKGKYWCAAQNPARGFLKKTTENAADDDDEKQLEKGSDSLGSQSRVVTTSKKDCQDDLKLKLEEFAADRKKELDRLKADVMSEMHHQINEMKKEVTSTGLVMQGINGDLTDIKNRMKALLEKAQQGKQLVSMGSDKAIKDLQKSMTSHEQKFNAVEIKVDTEVKRVEDMLTALSSNAATAESQEECMTRLEKVEDLVVGGKRKLDRIYTAIRTMAEFEKDVEKDTDSDKDGSSFQIHEDKSEQDLDGSRSPPLARRRGGGQGPGRGRPRGRGRYKVTPAQSGAGEGA